MQIRVLNPVWSTLLAGDKEFLKPCLSFDSYVYRKVKEEYAPKQFRFRKKRCSFASSLIDKSGLFLTGFIPSIKKYCGDRETPLEIIEPEKPYWVGKLPGISGEDKRLAADLLAANGIKLREDQMQMIRNIHYGTRGVIHSPTRSGKTIIMLGTILFNQPGLNVLILTPSTDLVTQGIEDFKPFFHKTELGMITGDIIEPARITFSNIQKFARIPISKWHEGIDVIICDECHHVNSLKGSWAKVLRNVPAHMRLGFTATLPYEPEGIKALEGLIGPTIGTVEMDTLIEKGVLAKPKLKIIKSPYNHKVHELKNWAEVYDEGIVHNRMRNRLILREARTFKEAGLTTLIIVRIVEHGKILENTARVMFPDLNIKYIHGKTVREIREETKKALTKKELDVVITSIIWREGVTIQTLGAVINAAGGKERIFPVQALGRGLGVAEGKTEVFLIDFFDPSHPFLIDHFGHRISLYFELGWIQ